MNTENKLDAVDVDESSEKISFWKKLQTTVFTLAALMISSGQFNDTKELLGSLYEDVLANFTNSLEYELIEGIHVGNSLAFVKEELGEPYVIKRSSNRPELRFQYFSEEKFELTLITDDERIVGYTVFSKEDGFSPAIPFAEELGEIPLMKSNDNPSSYFFDVNNLIYFVEAQELGKQQMFLTLVRGFVEYGAVPQTDKVEDDYNERITDAVRELNDAETFGSESEIDTKLNRIREQVFPNFFAIGEVDAKVLAESLLTRYEYQMFTQS